MKGLVRTALRLRFRAAFGACVTLAACTPGGEIALRPDPGLGAAEPACLDSDAGTDSFDPSFAFAPEVDSSARAVTHRYFTINVLDSASRAPIAGASLETVNDVEYISDDAGHVAYYEPGLMGQTVYFSVTRKGYQIPKDVFGYRGKGLPVTEGGSGEILLDFVSNTDAIVAGHAQTDLLAAPVTLGAGCFSLRVVDQRTKRGVPLVTLATDRDSFVTDSQGFVAFCDRTRLGTSVTFAVSSHGYSFDAGAVELTATAGQSQIIEITRENVAERMYRLTGQGIYRESALLGLTSPLAEPLLTAHVMGQDSGAAVIFGGQLFWTWGTTARVDYPLGTFGVSGATSDLPAQQGLDPRVGVDLTYSVDSHDETVNMTQNIAPKGSATWLSVPVVLPDATGAEQLLAVFAKPNGDLSVNRQGVARFDPVENQFLETGVDYPLSGFVVPAGEPVIVNEGADSYVYYGSSVRVPAHADSFTDLAQYQVFSAFAEGGGTSLDRASDGSLAYDFKRGALASSASALSELEVSPAQALDGHLTDATSGTGFQATGGVALSYSERRHRFIRLVEQLSGTTSFLGELWYLEGDTPMGPWVYARKIVTHDNYSFTSPWLHPALAQDSGRYLFFEGNYTSTLAGDSVVNTPRYNGNQLMYRLDLEDDRLALPVPVYDTSNGSRQSFATKSGLTSDVTPQAALFFAPDRRSAGTLPVFWSGAACEPRQLALADPPLTPPLFFAFAPSAPDRPNNTIELNDFSDPNGGHAYDVASTLSGFTPAGTPLAYVWPSPIAVRLPLAPYLGSVVASAGPDICVTEGRAAEGADVTLQGTAPVNLDGGALHFSWRGFAENCTVGEGAALSMHLSAGVHAFTLVVSNDHGASASDDVIVSVAALR